MGSSLRPIRPGSRGIFPLFWHLERADGADLRPRPLGKAAEGAQSKIPGMIEIAMA